MSVLTRLLVAVGLLLLGAFAAVEYSMYREVRQLAGESLRAQAQRVHSLLLAMRRVYHHQFLDSGLPVTEQTMGFLPVRAMDRILTDFVSRDSSGIRFDNVSDRPRNPEHSADEHELRAMAYFRSNPEAQVYSDRVTDTEGRPVLLYAHPIWVEPNCLECHGDRSEAPPAVRDNYETAYDYEVGDLRGVLSIRVPASEVDDRVAAHLARTLPVRLGLLGALLAVIFLLQRRYVRRPLRQLATAMRQFELGRDSQVPALAGELAGVSEAFNAMSEMIRDQQAALRDSESKYRRVVEDSLDAIFITDAELKLVEANVAMCTLLGYDRASLLRMPVGDVCVDAAQLAAVVQRVATVGSVQFAELQLRCSDGTERTVTLTATAQHSEVGGELMLVHGIIRDITEERRAQEERARLVTALEQAGDAVIVTDLRGQIVYVNPAFEKVTGYLRAEVYGAPASVLRSGRHEPKFYGEMWSQLRRGEMWEGRFLNRRKAAAPGTDCDEEQLLYEVKATISPVRDASGTIVNFVGVMRDVTREASLQEQLRHSQKMDAVGRLAGGVAHDFNNMLTAILGTVEWMLRDSSALDPKREGLLDVQEAARRAAVLTRRLLAFGRRQVAAPVVIKLDSLLGDLGNMLRRLIGEHIALTIQVEPGTHAIRADVGQVEQVITNLVVNARDAMPAGGTIAILAQPVDPSSSLVPTSLAGHDKLVMLSVVDTGCGISEELRGRIFDPFFTTKQVGHGTGLGLSIVYGIVGQSGGAVELSSQLGEGSTFRLFFPGVVGAQPALPEAVPPLAVPSAAGRRILLAEDESLVRRLTEGILRGAGFDVLVACDGQEALRMLDEHRDTIDLALLDVVMPKVGGRAVYERLQRGEPKVPVLFVSGYNDGETHTSFLLDQGLCFLGKPYDAQALLRAVGQALNSPSVGLGQE